MQPTYAQSTTIPSPGPGTRARKPTLDEMGSAASRPVPARDAPSPRLRGEGRGEGQPQAPRSPVVDPRAKAGAYGEQVRGPHKPTLDEMGPHAERGLPVAGKPLPLKPPVNKPRGSDPSRTAFDKSLNVGGEGSDPLTREQKKHRHGRPRKTGRPGK